MVRVLGRSGPFVCAVVRTISLGARMVGSQVPVARQSRLALRQTRPINLMMKEKE